ncbi:MAG: hypothetical protein M0013_03785 [Actinomycetota bacterium]|nr:hypothetical protein [Actinomycetota bacterium]
MAARSLSALVVAAHSVPGAPPGVPWACGAPGTSGATGAHPAHGELLAWSEAPGVMADVRGASRSPVWSGTVVWSCAALGTGGDAAMDWIG